MDKPGETIKRIRLSLGLSQKELGDKIDIKMNTICGYECHRRIPNYKNARKLKDFFEIKGVAVSYDELLQGK